MTDWKTIVKQLQAQNELPDTGEPQREANLFRIEWLERLHKEKAESMPTVFLDPVIEALKDKEYSCSPARIMGSTR